MIKRRGNSWSLNGSLLCVLRAWLELSRIKPPLQGALPLWPDLQRLNNTRIRSDRFQSLYCLHVYKQYHTKCQKIQSLLGSGHGVSEQIITLYHQILYRTLKTKIDFTMCWGIIRKDSSCGNMIQKGLAPFTYILKLCKIWVHWPFWVSGSDHNWHKT